MPKLRILVVDDDRDFADSLAEVLRLDGHTVDTAYTGEKAIENFRQQDYDLTFMDVKLPGKSGVQRFLEMREMKPSARVFMTTGFSVPQLLDEAIARGACGVLQKPLDLDRLLEMVNKIMPEGILIADDDPDFVESVRELLSTNGYHVYVARDGKEAVHRVIQNGIDILILDLRMPMLSGLEVYLELRQRGRSLPTIIVTAFAHDEAAALDELRNFSVTGILTKPFNPAELLAAVKKIAERGR